MNYRWIQLLPLPRAPNSSSNPTWLALATPLAQLMTPLRAIYHTHTHTSDKLIPADHMLEKAVPMQRGVDACRRSLVPSVSFGDPTNSSSLQHINMLLHLEGDLYIITDVRKTQDFSLQKALLGVIRILTRRSSHVRGGLKEHFLHTVDWFYKMKSQKTWSNWSF